MTRSEMVDFFLEVDLIFRFKNKIFLKNLQNMKLINSKLEELEFKPEFLETYIEEKAKIFSNIDIKSLVKTIIRGLPAEMTTSEYLMYCAEICASSTTKHYEYNLLAASIEIEATCRNVEKKFSAAMIKASQNINMNENFMDFVTKNAEKLDNAVENLNYCDIDYFGIKTLIKNMSLKKRDQNFEYPKHIFMRSACQIHLNNVEDAIQTFHLMFNKYFTHATPTLHNSGRKINQLCSCFLIGTEDSIDGLLKTIKKLTKIAASGGGSSVHIHNCRASGTVSETSAFSSSGIIPMLRVFNSIVRCINQNNNRFGATAIYLEPWHQEIFDFIELRKNTGSEEMRTRDLFLGLWVPDLFMERVAQNGQWSLFCPYKCPGLEDSYGDKFKELYERYEQEGRASKTVKAQSLWKLIIKAQIETGNPYFVFKDACNKRSNQKNLGTIKSSNLCAEIIQYSDSNEIAVCNLASIALPSYINDENRAGEVNKIFEDLGKNASFPKVLDEKKDIFEKYFSDKSTEGIKREERVYDKSYNLRKLYLAAKLIIKNLNNVIDVTYYPLEENRTSNLKNRPIGMGVQGLADVFAILRVPFDSNEAKDLNKYIFETIHYAALESSCEIAKEKGTYENYEGSPISQGILAPDQYETTPELYDWAPLREKVKKYGVRNSLLVALMPTASTSQIFSFNECFEPFTSNLYLRRTVAGEFQIVNKYLMKELEDLNMWTPEIKNLILEKDGSIQSIQTIPKKVRDIYKNVWEMKMKTIIDLAADRSPYVCQSQSMNVFIPNPTYSQLTSMHFYSYKKGLKTGMYYLRTKPISQAIKFTVDREMAKRTQEQASSSCSMDDPDCFSCGS